MSFDPHLGPKFACELSIFDPSWPRDILGGPKMSLGHEGVKMDSSQANFGPKWESK